MKYFELFAGVGGFGIGIQNADPTAECIGFSEIDKYASQVLKHKHPNIPNYGDITKINWAEVPDFDLLTGGSPCQDFSIAGKRAGIEGARSGLVWEYIRCLEEKKPKYFIWENVKGVLSSRRGYDFGNILTAFSESGYSLWWQVLNAKDFGVPQNRERVFVVGFREGCPPEVFFERGTDAKDIQNLEPGANQANRRYDTSGISPTVPTSGGGRHIPMIMGLDNGARENTSGIASTLTSRDYKGLNFRDMNGVMDNGPTIMNMHISARNPKRKSADRGGSGPLMSQDKSFAVETGQPHYVIETNPDK